MASLHIVAEKSHVHLREGRTDEIKTLVSHASMYSNAGSLPHSKLKTQQLPRSLFARPVMLLTCERAGRRRTGRGTTGCWCPKR